MENFNDYSYIARQTGKVRQGIREAAKEAGRDESDVTLVAAVKYADDGEIAYLCGPGGVRDVGENRVQQLLAHYEALPNRDEVRFHFIGTLQKNKVKYLIGKVCMIHSVDSAELAQEIERRCEKAGCTMDVLVEINSGREENKSGVMPEQAGELCLAIAGMPHLRLRGFMTMAPVCQSAGEYRNYFRETYRLCLDIWTEKLHNIERPVFSMGMSQSYREAILEGATMVRVGRTLFDRSGSGENEETTVNGGA